MGSHTFKEWQKIKNLCGNRCLMCGKSEIEVKLSEDHIWPLSMNGPNDIENIQPLCISCNSKKGNKLCNFGLPKINFSQDIKVYWADTT